MSGAILTRELRLEAPAAAPAPDAPIPCTVASTTPVNRRGVLEVLDCSPAGVDLSRAPLPLIITHNANNLSIGLVENLRATGDRVTGQVRFSASAEAQQIRADVLGGIHRSLSVGYAYVDDGSPIEGGLIFRWQPHEVSIVPVPADPAAGFFRSHPGVQTMQIQPMQTATVPVQKTSEDIIRMCRHYKAESLAAGLINQGATDEQTRAAILEELARRDFAAGGHFNVAPSAEHSGVKPEREILINTLVQRMGGKVKGDVLRAADCTGLAVRALQLGGYNVNYQDSRDQIIHRAMGTSDFPALLGNAAGRVLLAAFDEAPAVLKQVARMNNLPNFKDRTVIRLPGGAPSLEKVNEHGEFKHGGVAEAANGWRLATFGRICSLTRQALVNDDLGAFSGLLNEFGRSAARRESDELVNMLVGTPLVDGSPLFHVDRSSLITTTLTMVGLALAVKSLRLQKEIGGGFIIQEPAFLVVPAALETLARQLVTSITPATTSSVQPYRVSIIVEPRLDAISPTAWYLVANNQQALEYGYLDGAQGPATFQELGFEVDGMQIKCRLDFGTGWVAPVGWVKSSGTVTPT